MSIIKTVTILYGQGCCYNMEDGSQSRSSKFASIEESFYLSKKDIFSPVHSDIERRIFRNAKRGEK